MAEVMEIDPVQPSAIDTKAQEDYQRWKSNAPALYDYLNTYNNIWPSLTVEFFPDRDEAKARRTTYRLLTSTYTSSSLPQHLQIQTFTTKATEEETDLTKYDAELGEFNTTDPISGKINTLQKILHRGDINKSKILPQNPDLIATITSSGSVYVFDKTKHPSNETEFKCEVECRGHLDEGFGLAWNGNREGQLLSAGMDGDIRLFDLNKFKKGSTLGFEKNWKSEQGVNDVDWCSFHDSVFVSGGENNVLRVWDVRSQTAKTSGERHEGGVNAVSWSKGHQFMVCSGGGDGVVNAWDIRSFKTPVSTIKAHDGGISTLEINPVQHNVVATGGMDDNTVKLLDLSEERELFVHRGHLLGVNDVAWNPHDPWMLGSVSNDNTVQLWKPSLESI